MYRARLLPFDAIRREQKKERQFFVVVVSQSNRNCDIGLRSKRTDVHSHVGDTVVYTKGVDLQNSLELFEATLQHLSLPDVIMTRLSSSSSLTSSVTLTLIFCLHVHHALMSSDTPTDVEGT